MNCEQCALVLLGVGYRIVGIFFFCVDGQNAPHCDTQEAADNIDPHAVYADSDRAGQDVPRMLCYGIQ
jgi:hypothetical protein